jgi:hypothetical protein
MGRRYALGVPRKQLVTRLVYGVFVLVVAAFTISNVVQVATVVFASPEAAPKVGPACAVFIEENALAIESALRAALSETDRDAAKARYSSERGHSSGTTKACEADPNGPAALAALARLDRAAESQAVRTATDLHSVRVAAQSFISRSR